VSCLGISFNNSQPSGAAGETRFVGNGRSPWQESKRYQARRMAGPKGAYRRCHNPVAYLANVSNITCGMRLVVTPSVNSVTQRNTQTGH